MGPRGAGRSARFHSVDQAQQLAKRRVPRSVYRFLEGGTVDEFTVRANRRVFEDVTFLPRAAVVHRSPVLRTVVLGHELSMPIIVAPAGYIRLAHRDGEIGVARAAGRAGIPTGISTLSSHDIADIKRATTGPVWYQLYFAGGRAGAEVAIERAKDAGCSALILTVDVAAAAGRERTLRGGGVPTRISMRTALQYAPDVLPRPRWLFDFLRDGMRLDVPNVRTAVAGPSLTVGDASKSMRSTAPRWEDLSWIRESWPGPIVMKGILRVEDARRAVGSGVDAIVVSNHGGNALDSTPPTLRVLPGIVDAVGSDLEVLVDSGFRRGADVVKALALGARAVLIGRAYIWALAAAGEPGVDRILQLLREGMASTLTLLGCPSVEALDRTYVDAPWL
jgi:isopentenyl diphosphate isomerase/L-lactate dehydrogenase-like FMN-dependent dehydrogenase